MSFQELLRLVYGVFMGTSTHYIKPQKRYLFPMTETIVEPLGCRVFLGGSANALYYSSKGEGLLVNPGQAEAAAWIYNQLDVELKSLRSLKVIALDSQPNFMDGWSKYQNFPQFEFHVPSKVFERYPDLRQENFIRVYDSNPIHLSVADQEFDLFCNSDFLAGKTGVLKSRSHRLVMFGSSVYNRVHLPIGHYQPLNLESWVAFLNSYEKLALEKSYQIIPAEGQMGGAEVVSAMKDYLMALADPKFSFSDCRRDYDWQEIIGQTSLEENFDLIRNNQKNFIHLA